MSADAASCRQEDGWLPGEREAGASRELALRLRAQHADRLTRLRRASWISLAHAGNSDAAQRQEDARFWSRLRASLARFPRPPAGPSWGR